MHFNQNDELVDPFFFFYKLSQSIFSTLMHSRYFCYIRTYWMSLLH